MQINTGLLSLYHHEELLVTNVEAKDRSPYMYAYAHRYGIVATIYVGLLLMLLMIYAFSCIAILKTKQILNSKFSVSSRKSKIVIQNSITVILSICIAFQKMVVVACKMMAFIPIFFVIGVLYGIRGWKWMKAMFSSEGTHVTPGQLEKFKDLQCHILTLEDDIELAERTLKGITKSVNLVI
ncbi:hypothetical protein Hanom_Chr09g00862061 [Helianthus anomalus]